MIYNKFFNDKQEQENKIDKIFCILEGKEELLLLKKIFELIEKNQYTCEDFVENKIKLMWGKQDIQWIKKEDCNFQGGNLRSCKTPMPVIEALKNSNYELYKGIVICYDKDCDNKNYVFNNVISILNKFDYYLCVNDPCLEKEIILLIKEEKTEEFINLNYEIIEKSKCKWYKRNFAKLPKLQKYSRFQSLESIIRNLHLQDLINNDKIKNLLNYIKENSNA